MRSQDEPGGEADPESPFGESRSGPLGPRRSPVDLYAEVLEVLRRSGGPCRVTRLSYAVGMPVDRTKATLSMLVNWGLATKEPGEVASWRLTRRGFEFLQIYWKMRSYMAPVEGFIDEVTPDLGERRDRRA